MGSSLQPILPVGPPPQKSQALLIVFALICSNLFALFVTFIFEFLSLRGVVHLGASRIVLFMAWGSGVVAICAFAWGTSIRAKWFTVLGGSLLLAASLWALDAWAPKLGRSFVYVAPAFLTGPGFRLTPQNTPDVMWSFLVMHRGPDTAYNVEVLFVDRVSQGRMRGKRNLTPADVDSYQLVRSYPEIDAHGRGNIFAQPFFWVPSEPDYEWYHVILTSRDGSTEEDLQIERISKKWFYAMTLKDRENGKVLLDCEDKGFSVGSKKPACFPEISQND